MKSGVSTKAMARISIAVLLAVFCLPGLAQERPQDGGGPGGGQGGGMGGGQSMAAAFAQHGVQGTVTAISGGDITVKTEDGATYKIQTGANTHFRKQREQIALTDIHVGDMVGAFGDKDDKAKTVGAVAVMVFDKEQFEKARADFGKTWTAGSVQSIDDTKITIKRPDNVTQVIVVDENTSFHKRRDAITLADIKVGDNVNARGSLQGGNFLATTLSVGGPGGGGGFRGRPEGAGGAGPVNAPGSAPGSAPAPPVPNAPPSPNS